MPTSLLWEQLSPSQCPLPCIWRVLEERLLQSFRFIRNDGDQVVVLLIRPGHSLLGLDLSQHSEGTHPPCGAVDPVGCSLVALWQQSLVSLPSLLGWRGTEYGLSNAVGLRLFASGHITLRQCWGSFAIQLSECWLSRSRGFGRELGASRVTAWGLDLTAASVLLLPWCPGHSAGPWGVSSCFCSGL